jgi:hypothetical protein
MRQIAIVIDWFGPYSLETAKKMAREEFDSGLYMVIGKQKYQKSNAKLQYIGIATWLENRLCYAHETLCKIEHVHQVWLGEVVSTGVPGPKDQVRDVQLELAEWAHVYFTEVQLNEKKKSTPPRKPVTVINRWWKPDEKPRLRKVHRDWPELIDYRGEEYGAVIYNGKRHRHVEIE